MVYFRNIVTLTCAAASALTPVVTALRAPSVRFESRQLYLHTTDNTPGEAVKQLTAITTALNDAAEKAKKFTTGNQLDFLVSGTGPMAEVFKTILAQKVAWANIVIDKAVPAGSDNDAVMAAYTAATNSIVDFTSNLGEATKAMTNIGNFKLLWTKLLDGYCDDFAYGSSGLVEQLAGRTEEIDGKITVVLNAVEACEAKICSSSRAAFDTATRVQKVDGSFHRGMRHSIEHVRIEIDVEA